jgi:Do/DeqQ family serine protease
MAKAIAALLSGALLSTAALAGEVDPARRSLVVQAVERASPAVVNISTEEVVERRGSPFPFPQDPFFDEFFRDFFDARPQRFTRTSLGSGVIVDGNGTLLTNQHVVLRATRIHATLADGREFDAKLVGADADTDLAVLRIAAGERLPAVTLGTSADLMIGETLIAIGNPFGFSHTVTTGVISALNRSVRSEERVLQDFIQIDASINPGNSGGPLLNINGELIGINTAIYAKAQGIGFAIPIGKARKVVADLIRYGEVKPPWIGLSVQEIDERTAQYLGFPGRKGVMVRAVEPQSPAERGGFRERDIVTAVGSRKIAALDDYQAALQGVAAGESVEVQVWRAGKTISLELATREYPLERADELAWSLLGVRVAELNAKNRREFRIAAREGVVIAEVRSGSQLARIGARPGDVLRQIDDTTVASPEEFRRAVIKYRQKASLVLLIQRGEQGYYVTGSL